MGKVFVFDVAKCNGCRNCQIACKDEHVGNDWSPISLPQPDTGHFWNNLSEHVRGQVPKVKVFYNEELDVPQKCTGCAHLVNEGELPHCVDVCPHGAIQFGDEEDFAEQIAASEPLMPERADADQPRVYYLNLPKRFLAGVVVDFEEDEVVIGAKVTAENVDNGDVLVTETDEFGDFWFHQVAAANWRVYVEADGYMTRVIEASTADEDRNVGPIAIYAG